MSTLGVIGPGRAGTLVAIAARRAGYRVAAVTGGSGTSRRRFADLLGGVRELDTPAELAGHAETLLVAVPDDAVADVVRSMARADVLREGHRVVHLAGSLSVDVLLPAHLAGARTAACHPAMTIPDDAHDPDVLVGVAWAVTAGRPDRGWAHDFVRVLGGDPFDVPDEARAVYHAALAVGSNAVGASLATARQLLLAAGVPEPERFLRPLVTATIDNILEQGASALTGPVVRGDDGTVAAHRAAIEADLPELTDSYRHAMLVTLACARPGLSVDDYERLLALLAPSAGNDEAADESTP